MQKVLFILTTFIVSFTGVAQSPSDIQKPKDNKSNERLQACLDTYHNRPNDLNFGITVTDNNEVYFYCDDKGWFERLIAEKKDALSVDFVSEDQFKCGQPNTLDSNWLYNGSLMPLVYKKDMQILPGKTEHEAYVFLGKLPEELIGKKYEENLVIISDNILCEYTSFYNLEGHHWELLEMGLFTDSTSDMPNYDIDLNNFGNLMKNKTFTLTVPFEKNKADYKREDFEHFFNDNRLNSYQIDSIRIKAFASIEGTKSINENLLKQRSESISKALQEFQGEKFEYDIETHENWIEFFYDIKNTKYNSLRNTEGGNDAIRAIVNEKYKEELEPILSHHRKAVVEVYVTYRDEYNFESVDEAQKEFDKALQTDLQKAMEIQKSIYSKVQTGVLSESLIDSMTIPTGIKYSLLNNNALIFKYENNPKKLLQAVKGYGKLLVADPTNYRLKYNSVALSLKLWAAGHPYIRRDKLQRGLSDLYKSGLNPVLINRLLINYNIISTEYLMKNRQFQQKDQVLYQTYQKYSNIQFNDENLVSLAKYFVHYNQEDWAVKLLLPHVKRLDVSEDLLYYFINLTITQESMVNHDLYTPLLLNAQHQNPKRFCELFNTIEDGGVTLQLLSSKVLKGMKCEFCK